MFSSPLITIEKGKNTSLSKVEVFLNDLPFLSEYDEVEVTVSYYPYSREVKGDHFHFNPYEDYVLDLTEGKRSTYQSLRSSSQQIFGMMLGSVILGYFFFFFPQLLLSVESVVLIFAAYTVGKEIWLDVDDALQHITGGWRVRWTQQSFFYVLQQFGTLQRFWQLARQKRYGYQLTLPYKIDFISHSNSKTIEMLFRRSDLTYQKASRLRVLSIHFDTHVTSKVSSSLGLIIVRVALVKNILGLRQIEEWYQGCDGGDVGALDLRNHWQSKKSLHKSLLAFGRLFVFLPNSRLRDNQVVENKMTALNR